MGLKQGDILVYAVIKDYKNAKTGQCNPGLDKEIVPRTGLSKNFVLSSISRLEKVGLITVIRKRGTSNQYTFKEIGDEFDRFAKAFLDIKDLEPNTKEFYMKIQEYLFVSEDGMGRTTYNLSQLAELADVDWKSAKKYMKELQDKGYVILESTALTEETGFKMIRCAFDLDKLQQAILYKLKQHDDNIQDLYARDKEKDKKIVNLEKEVERLKRELRLQSVKDAVFYPEL